MGRVVHLPSGRRADITPKPAGAAKSTTLAGAREALEGAVVVREAQGEPSSLGELPLADFNVLRAAATQLGVLAELPVQFPCENCDAQLEASPCALLELGPFFDGELSDPELDAPFEFGASQAIPELEMGSRIATSVVFEDRTLNQARALHEALSKSELRITSAVVAALGITALGEETQPARIARALTRASDEIFSRVIDRFDEAHYPPRLTAWVRCDACGAKSPLEGPALREFPSDAALGVGGERSSEERSSAPSETGFPTLAEFEALVTRHAKAVYARKRVTGVALVVEPGTPHCDDGGVPLLGSYEPPFEEGGGITWGPDSPGKHGTIRLYYKTFARMHADEPYDVEDEILETLRHELDHHVAWLSGIDAEDDEERAEIVREDRRAVGETESLRRAARAARGELGDFLYRTWPLWVIVVIGTVLASLAR